MARISKSGLDYFPLDVNFLQDRKVRRISSRHHAARDCRAHFTVLPHLQRKKDIMSRGIRTHCSTLHRKPVARRRKCRPLSMTVWRWDYSTLIYIRCIAYSLHKLFREQYHKIITDSRRKYKLPLEHFWLITDGETEQQKDEYGKENSIAKSENENRNENRNGNRAGTGNGTVSDAAVNDIYATKTGINAAKSPEIATTIPQTKEETDTKGKQETEKERDRGTETKAERDREKEIEKRQRDRE